MIERAVGGAAVPWATDEPGRHRLVARAAWEWLPRPHAGRIMLPRRKANDQTLYVQIVPGPERTWQVCRIDLGKPFARGFRTKEQARRWIAGAMKAGIIPEGVVEVEPPPSGGG